jgi:hypothetical protein
MTASPATVAGQLFASAALTRKYLPGPTEREVVYCVTVSAGRLWRSDHCTFHGPCPVRTRSTVAVFDCALATAEPLTVALAG